MPSLIWRGAVMGFPTGRSSIRRLDCARYRPLASAAPWPRQVGHHAPRSGPCAPAALARHPGACYQATVTATQSRPQTVPHRAFAALYVPGYGAYLGGSALAMMADSIEHVISYWMVFQKFHSPALGGYAVISHWVPFLLF